MPCGSIRFGCEENPVGFFDWLLGRAKKRPAKRPAVKAAVGGAPTPPTGQITRGTGQNPKDKHVLKSEQESSQARDIVRAWMKDDD